ncbi:MAG: methionine--tRNA ligase [Elusimicrobia bacterium]|nr:methionine--tRNA ligase [Elusimicrobiota bacterium]
MTKKLYITTPLYYVNASPHIGHAYTTLAADILARWHRQNGREVHLLTGTDEHGSKIEQAAAAAGVSPQAYADKVSQEFRDLWVHLDVRHDDYIRTTEDRHKERVQAAFRRLKASGDVYKGVYKGYYCVSCETYWTETDAPPDEKGRRLCPNPDCRKPLKVTEEESWFFKLSTYGPRLLEHYKAHPGFLQPAHRAKEIENFVGEGLRDLAISRTKVSWGVPVPDDPGHVVYVWFDALLNYVTATGWFPEGDAGLFEQLWPADVQLVGKEIYRFHTVIWPAMLMALGVEPPRSVFAHGWWTVEGQKMSKSKGNFVDPREVTREFGVDAFRYFLFREMPFGNDGDFSLETLRRRYNAELANDLGNLVSRVTNMVDKYLNGALPGRPTAERIVVTRTALDTAPGIAEAMERLAFQDALNRVWAVVGELNVTVDRRKPWELAKADPEALKWLLWDLVHALRMVAGWIAPFMPQTAAKIQMALGVRHFPAPLSVKQVLEGPAGEHISKSPPLFPRK